MSRIRKLASETAIYGISSVVGRLINFALVPFYVNVFDIGEYGVVVAVFTAVVFLNVVFTYGMESSYLKYASGAEGRPHAQRIFSTVIWSIVVTSVVLSALVIVLRNPVSDLINVQRSRFYLMYYVLGIMALDAVAVIPFAELRLQNRPWRFAAIKVANITVNVGLNLGLIVGLGMGIDAIFIANLAASGLALGLLWPQFRLLLRPMFDRPLWGELLRFGLPFVPGGLAYVLAERSSIVFLGKLGRERVLALYGAQIDQTGLAEKAAEAAAHVTAQWGSILDPSALAERVSRATDLVYGQEIMGIFGGVYKLAIAMMLLAQMFRYAWQPFFLQHASDPDARSLFARVFTLFNAIAFFVFLLVSFYAKELVSLPIPFSGRTLIPSSYWVALDIIPVALLAYAFQGWYYVFSAGVYIEKKTRYLVHCTVIGGVVSVALNLALVPHYGMMGAAWAILVAFGAMALSLFLFTRRFYPVPYAWGSVLATSTLGLALFVLWSELDFLHRWWIEAGLLLLFAGALPLLRVVPPGILRELARRGPPKRPGSAGGRGVSGDLSNGRGVPDR